MKLVLAAKSLPLKATNRMIKKLTTRTAGKLRLGYPESINPEEISF